MNRKIDSNKAVLNIKDKLEDTMYKHFIFNCMDTKDEVVETLENDEYDYIQFKNKNHTDTDARLIATTALLQADKQMNSDIYLFISGDVIAYTSNPVQYRQQKIDGRYELIEVSDAVDMLNKGDSL